MSLGVRGELLAFLPGCATGEVEEEFIRFHRSLR